MYILLVFLALGSVNTHDILVGPNSGGKKVFDEHFQASPAVWRQTQNVSVHTTDDEVINRIVITDLREDKDGEAKIVDGGEGQKKVTIELKSPTVLRGYDFKVEVYAEPNKEYQANPLNKNGPPHPSEFKANAGNLNAPYSGGKITLTNLDETTKLPEVSTTQASKSQTEVKPPGIARETRDTEIKKAEDDKHKLNAPSVFGNQNHAATIVKSKDNNSPVTIGSKLAGDDHDKTTEAYNDEAKRVRDTHDDATTTKITPKSEGFDAKTFTTTTFTTPIFNGNPSNPANNHPALIADDRKVRATNEDDENVSPTLVPSQRNPTVYTPNFDSKVPSIVKNVESDKKEGKPVNDKLNNQKRDARDTHEEAKENTPKLLTEDVTKVKLAGTGAENVTKDEERKTRSAQKDPIHASTNGDVKEGSSLPLFTNKQINKGLASDDTNKHSLNERAQEPEDDVSKNLNPISIGTQNPVPYPIASIPRLSTTTKSPQKRDTVPTESKDDKTILSPKLFGAENATNHDQKMPIVSLQ